MQPFIVLHYLAVDGRAPFQRWFERLGPTERARIAVEGKGTLGSED
jgi:hypothetical protein